MNRLIVRGGTVVSTTGTHQADVVVEDGRIAGVTAGGAAEPTGAELIDAGGLLVFPGMVDAHVHFDEPGREQWEGFDSGSAAAVAGGVTTVVDMPIDCDPPTVTAAAVAAKADAAARHSRVDVAAWGGLTPLSVGDVGGMIAAGVVGLKAFTCPSGWDEFPPVDGESLAAGARAAARYDLPVAVHCELASLGPTAESEVAAVRWAAGIVTGARARVHVVHVSAVEAVDEARRWPGTTVETCPHYLYLADDDRPVARCSPPVRDEANRDALWARLPHIDWVASDHSPCPPAERADGWCGIDGVGMTLPLLASDHRLDPPTLARLTTAAARHLRLPGKGVIAHGYDADLALVDPAATWTLDPASLYSRHRASPFLGHHLRGRVVLTIVRGRVAFSLSDGPAPAGGGRFVRPTATSPTLMSGRCEDPPPPGGYPRRC